MKQSQFILIGIIVLVLLGGGGYLLMKGSEPPQTNIQMQESPTPEVMQPTSGSSGAMEQTTVGATKTFTITANNFSYDVKEINVNKGDTVTILFKNAEGMHDWKLDEFNAATQKLQAGEEETVTFVADKAGTFEYYCSVGKHRQMGMVGKLIVE